MRLVMFSLDPKIADSTSRVRVRMQEYASEVDELAIILLAGTKEKGEIRDGKLSIYLSGSRSAVPFFYWLTRIFWGIRIGKDLANKFKLGDKDVWMTSHEPFGVGLITTISAMWAKVPYELQVHTDIGSPAFRKESIKNRLFFLLSRVLLPHANRIRVVSNRIKNFLVSDSRFQIPDSKIVINPVFVDTEYFKNAPIKIDLHKKYPQFEKIVLVMSRLTREKNIPLAIDAFRELLKTNPKTGLVIVGEGPEKGNLESGIWNQNLGKNIIMEPWCDDPASYYKTADCFLITSDYEGYGMTIVEALAAGCPVVSTDVGIAKEAGASIGTDAAKLGALLLQTLIGYGRNKLPETFLVDKQRYLETMKLSWKELEAGEVSSWCHVFGIFFRFFVTGCTGAVINLGSLYSLTRWAHLWYVTATCLAFLFAFLVTFFLQKHWTFRVKEAGDTGKQMLQYVIVAGINLVLNVIIIYALVEWVAPYTVKSWLYGPALYTAAAFISNGFIAIESFVVYRIFIFKKK